MQKMDVIEDIESKAIVDDVKPIVDDDKAVVDDELVLEHNQKSPNVAGAQTSTQEKDYLMKTPSRLFIILTVVAVIAGVGTGFGSFKLFTNNSGLNRSGGSEVQELPSAEKIKVGDIYGDKDKEYDGWAEGYLEEGGLDGEGSHKLLRPGGASQTVVLTSSVTDLSQLAGSEVKIWGESFKGQKAGWLMDVGRVEVLKVNAESPAEE